MANAFLDHSPAPLVADLGDFAHAALCYQHGFTDRLGVFEFWFPEPPQPWNYLVFAGLEPVLQQLRQFRVAPEQVEYMRIHPAFATAPVAWFEHLTRLSFHGDVWSVPEGTVVFAPAPLVRVIAPVDVGVLLGHFLVGQLAEQIRIASHVSRLITAAAGRLVYHGCARHAASTQSGLWAARAAFVAGVIATTSTEAARTFGIPSQLLMSPVWPTLLGEARDAFRKHGEAFPTDAAAPVDVFDCLEGVQHALASAAPLQAVRLCGGDLAILSREVRKLLDAAQRRHTRIFADVGFDEYRVDKLVHHGAPIDGFVIDTAQTALQPGPVFKSTYQLVATADAQVGWKGHVRLTPGQVAYPYPKQVYREHAEDGSFSGDVITIEGEEHAGDAMLRLVMRNGEVAEALPSLEECRDRCVVQRVRLPAELLDLEWSKPEYPVRFSSRLAAEFTRHLVPSHRR